MNIHKPEEKLRQETFNNDHDKVELELAWNENNAKMANMLELQRAKDEKPNQNLNKEVLEDLNWRIKTRK